MDLVPPPGCWVHSAAAVGPSPIAGLGLFATERLPSGTVVLRLGGELVPDSELKRRLAEAAAIPGGPYIDTITIEHDLHLVIPPSRAHYGNHSCDPNLWYVDPYSLAARHDIEPGQELTNDYATTTGVPDWEMDCLCGSLLCRRRVTGRDWTSPDLQDRYGPHWTPALRQLIAGA
jgi:SET domain-containing protein